MKNLREKELRIIADEILPEHRRDMFIKFFQLRFLEDHAEQSMYTDEYARQWAHRFNSKVLFQACDSASFDILIALDYPLIWTFILNEDETIGDCRDCILHFNSCEVFTLRGKLCITNCTNYYTFQTYGGVMATDEEEKQFKYFKKLDKL